MQILATALELSALRAGRELGRRESGARLKASRLGESRKFSATRDSPFAGGFMRFLAEREQEKAGES